MALPETGASVADVEHWMCNLFLEHYWPWRYTLLHDPRLARACRSLYDTIDVRNQRTMHACLRTGFVAMPAMHRWSGVNCARHGMRVLFDPTLVCMLVTSFLSETRTSMAKNDGYRFFPRVFRYARMDENTASFGRTWLAWRWNIASLGKIWPLSIRAVR